MNPEKSILIVDDNADYATMVALQLRHSGRAAVTSTSVKQALDVLDGDPTIGAVLTDVRMPGVDGLDFRRVLRHRFPGLPVVLMSGMPIDPNDMPPSVTKVLEKPFPIAALLEVLSRLD